MERNYLRPDSFIELDFTTEEHMGVHMHSDMEFLFVISGRVAVRVEENIYRLEQGDMLLVNVNRNHSYSASPDIVMGRFLIAYNKIREYLGKSEVLFWCNSVEDVNSAYEELKKLVCRIFNQYMYKGSTNSLYLHSLYFQMMHLMAESFLLSVDDHRYEVKTDQEDHRLQQIFAYIRTNYSQNITLEDMARELYLSPTYISKYIKKHCGMRFMELLTAVRLNHAVEDLLYLDTSIMKIALDNGFSSVAACNKAFKDAYQMTPSQFRKQRKSGRDELSAQEQEKRKKIKKSVDEYLNRSPEKQEMTTSLTELPLLLEANAPAVTAFNRCGLKMINAGAAQDLMNTRLCEQIAERRELMGFEYVRFWDIYAPEMYLDINARHEAQNYSRLDIVTDFLVKNHLKPYIELGAKPVRLLRSTKKPVRDIKRSLEFESPKQMMNFYAGLARHFVSRYGEDEVKGWYFEIWENTQIWYENQKEFLYTEISEQDHKAYFVQFNRIAGAIRKIVPDAKVGGAGFPVRLYRQDGFKKILLLWANEPERPDFISITCFPYSLEKEGRRYCEKHISDMDFVKHNIEIAVKAMQEAGLEKMALHVSEYSFSLSNRNIVNDSCIKGAFLVSNAISCLDSVDMAGHWLFSDIYADARDSGTVLFGGCGVLSKGGIPKPSYYAFEFLNKLYGEVLFKHDNIMITRGRSTSFRILCHNLKRPNYNYYIMEEDQISVKDLPAIMDDREFLTIRVEIAHLEEGVYLLRKNRVNRSCGSVQDKWMDLNMESGLTMKEQEYLEKSSISEIKFIEQNTIGHVLQFEIALEPNEIQYIDIRKKD